MDSICELIQHDCTDELEAMAPFAAYLCRFCLFHLLFFLDLLRGVGFEDRQP